MDEHSEILPLLAAYHDGELAAEAETQVRAHLENCSDCRTRLADWQALDRALRELPDGALAPGGIVDGVLATIGGAAQIPAGVERAWLSKSRRRVIWMAAAAAVLMIAVTGTLLRLAQNQTPRVEVGRSQERSDVAPDSAAPVSPRQADEEAPTRGLAPPSTDSLSGSRVVENRPDTPVWTGERERVHARAELEKTPEPPTPGPLASIQPTASVSVGDGDTGIPHYDDWPARLFDSIRIPIHFRMSETYPADLMEINLLPEFDVAFTGVGYAVGDLLSPKHEIRLGQPIELSDETSYLVSNLRVEQAALMTRVGHQVVSAEVSLRLAEVTWRLANLTADRDDVRSAIVAQTLAMRQKPELATQSRARVVHLQSLIR